MKEQLIYVAVVLALMLVSSALSFLLKKLGDGAHVRAERARADHQNTTFYDLTAQISAFAELAVLDVERTIRPALGRAAADGKLDDDEKKKLREIATSKVLGYLSPEKRAELEKAGLHSASLTEYVSTAVEAAHANLKTSEAA